MLRRPVAEQMMGLLVVVAVTTRLHEPVSSTAPASIL